MNGFKNRADGFSLLELLAVLSMMALLSIMAVTNYFSAIRGMARRGAVKHFVDTLAVARQRACIDNARVSVVLYNEISGDEDDDVIPSYVICKSVGKITYLTGDDGLVDEFSDLEETFGTGPKDPSYHGGFRLYNLSAGGFSYVYPWVFPVTLNGRTSPYTGEEHEINTFCFRVNDAIPSRESVTWYVGDSYGIDVAPVQNLPRSFLFGTINKDPSKILTITFLPDGGVGKSPAIIIKESRPPNKSVTITVDDGEITAGDWE